MPISLILGGLVFLAVVTAGTTFVVHERNAAVTAAFAKQAEAEKKLQVAADEKVQAAENSLVDMEAAFDAGQAEAEPKIKIVYAKGAEYAAADKGLSNLNCVMGADSLQFLNSARADVLAAAAARGPQDGLRGPSAPSGPELLRPVPASPAGRGAVPGLPQEPAALRSDGQVPGRGVPSHPKPKPIGGG